MNELYINEIKKEISEGHNEVIDLRDSRIPQFNSKTGDILQVSEDGYIIPISLNAGSGIDISLSDYIQISHANTSDQISIEENPHYFISSIVLDNFGHITSLKVKKEQDISDKADKATTLLGYGIADAYIDSDNIIHLGNQTITPIIEHQSLSGYATEQWVENKSYQNSNQVSDSISAAINNLSNVARSGAYNDLSGKPSLNFVPTAGGTMTGKLYLSGLPTTDDEAANKKYVDNVFAGISGIEFVIVSELPEVGEIGKIYLVPKADSTGIYDQYVWILAELRYQHIGSTAVDLSGYIQKPMNPNPGQVLSYDGNKWTASNPPDTGLIYTETEVQGQIQKDIKQNNVSKVSDIKEILGVDDLSYVKYSEAQSLTPQQKQIAQNNIGIEGFVKYSEAQSLSKQEKNQAQINIGTNTLFGITNPTTSTVGIPGQRYKLTVEPYTEFVCISDIDNTYIWKNAITPLQVINHTLYGPGMSVASHIIFSNY